MKNSAKSPLGHRFAKINSAMINSALIISLKVANKLWHAGLKNPGYNRVKTKHCSFREN